MTDRAFNALAIATASTALLITGVLPFVWEIPKEEKAPQTLYSVLPEPETKIPKVDYVFDLNARDEAWESMEEARALVEVALNIKPVRPFVPYTLKYVGKFYLTMYAATIEQCGSTSGITASGRKCTEDPTCWTVAVDPKIIPLGTYLKIDLEGYEDIIFRADDTGGDIKNYWIDIYTDSEPLSKTFNPTYAEVWIVDYV